MTKAWKTYKITSLMYLSIFIVSLSFYQILTVFFQMQKDTDMIVKAMILSTDVSHLHKPNAFQTKQITELEQWFASKENTQEDKYASQSFSNLLQCWKNPQIYAKAKAEEHAVLHNCSHVLHLSLFVIKNTLEIKETKMLNKVYLNFLVLSVLILLLIYFMRRYIYCQLSKGSIHDKETKLFNQNYFNSQLKIYGAKSQRTKLPFTLLTITISTLQNYTKKEKAEILDRFGTLILALTRVSDIACRSDNSIFSIFLPDTTPEDSSILEKRILAKLTEDETLSSYPITFLIKTFEYDPKNSIDEFRDQMQSILLAND